MSNSFIGNILKTKRKELNLSVKDVLEQLHKFGIDISDKTLYGWENGHRQPDADTFLILCNIYHISTITGIQQISTIDPHQNRDNAPSDLSEEAKKIARSYDKMNAHGKGAVKAILNYEEKELSHYSQHEDNGQIITLPKSRKNQNGLIEIKVYDQPAAAGLGNYLDEPQFRVEQYPEYAIPDKTDFGVLIDGDSMEPRIHDKGTVFVQSMPAIDPGKIGVFVLNDKAYCKKLVVDQEQREIRLSSLNPKYTDILVGEYDFFRTLGRVIGQWTPGKNNDDIFGW